MWGLTERLEWKDGVPPLNCPNGTWEDGDIFPASPFPPHVVTEPETCWQELTSANAACVMEIGWKKCLPAECPHPGKVNGTSP